MIYNKLYLNIIIRVSLITITCFILAYSFFRFRDWLLILNIIVLLALQVYLFVRSMNTTNYDLETFFTSLESNDISISGKYNKVSKSHQKLLERLDLIKQKITNLRMENEKQYHYFKAVVEHVGIGLMVCQPDGKIELLNEAGRKILNISRINNLSQLNQFFEGLHDNLINLSSGQQAMYRLNISNNLIPLSFKVNDYRFFDHPVRLFSFQNIKSELDAHELESWQKLIRVLTHEIMNSTGPIISSIDTIREFLIDENTGNVKSIEVINQNTIQDVLKGISIIKERSVGLSEFVQNFRSLTLKPVIKPEKFSVYDLFSDVHFLLKDEILARKIDFKITVLPKNLDLFADRKLIEQVILNLLYNSIEALEKVKDKQIHLNAFKDINGSLFIQISDNGKGIPEEIMDKIFVPFFTTRDKGSGIGLSISKQIMQLHQGTISVKSILNKETIFELAF